ncbi:substrate-binding periplasmic protein [Algicola sagamiensis]|uniref:substrate-binding periplasmic protein n=1 Tax=Algicola sagamiensis TaxID=163869 RepID=UPI00037785F6|nr:transporter substrate-binding domain-containing protein [Algicola sagamiensis]
MRLIFCSLILMTSLLQASELKKVSLAVGEWPPFIASKPSLQGICVNILSEAFKTQGIEVMFEFTSWKEAFENAKNAKIDGTPLWFYTKERAKQFYYSEPIITHKIVFFHLKDHEEAQWTTWKDLAKYRFVGTVGYLFSPKISPAFEDKTLTLHRTVNDEVGLRMILKRKADYTINDIDVGYYLIRTLLKEKDASAFSHTKKPIDDEVTSHFLVSRKHVESHSQRVLKAINAGLKEIKSTGRYDELLKKSRSPKM